jgi:hypothetical protein
MLAHRLYRFQQVTGGIGLYDIPAGAGIQRFTHHLRRVVLGNEQHFHPVALGFLLNQPAGFKAIHAGHGYVEYNDVGFQAVNFFQGFDPIRCFPYDFPPGAPFQ